jgi:uncharacterized membrane protein (UPF0127 family)
MWVTWRIISTENSNTKDPESPSAHRQRTGPEFKNEGTLHFIHPQNADTIKSIIIEVADTPERISRGLMYRTMITDDQGMLFILDSERPQTFWMKNTKIPLDIIFINGQNQIVRIAKHTIPYSTDPIPSMEPAKYVLEVKAGFCDEFKIEMETDVQFIINKSLSLSK